MFVNFWELGTSMVKMLRKYNQPLIRRISLLEIHGSERNFRVGHLADIKQKCICMDLFRMELYIPFFIPEDFTFNIYQAIEISSKYKSMLLMWQLYFCSLHSAGISILHKQVAKKIMLLFAHISSKNTYIAIWCQEKGNCFVSLSFFC